MNKEPVVHTRRLLVWRQDAGLARCDGRSGEIIHARSPRENHVLRSVFRFAKSLSSGTYGFADLMLALTDPVSNALTRLPDL